MNKFKDSQMLLLWDSKSPKVLLLLGSIVVIVYLTVRNSGVYPMIFGDEWLYNVFSRLQPVENSPRPMYLFFALYGLSNYCGDAFLDCARQINVIFFVLSVPLIYRVCQRFATKNLSVFVAICSVFSPINSYAAFFMPESMYFFLFWVFTWFVVKGYETKPAFMAAGAGITLACMSMVKPQGVFLFFALFVTFFSSWIFDRNAKLFKRACLLVVISITAFFMVRLPLGYMLAGTHGLSIMGINYNGYAEPLNDEYLIRWLSLARHNLWGHLLGVIVMFGVPFALILQIPLDKKMDYSESESKLRFLKLYTGSLLISLMIIIALFSAKVVFLENVSIERLSMRHYSFIFPLLLIITGASLNSSLKNKSSKIVIIIVAGLAVSALIAIGNYSPNIVDSPELFAFHSSAFVFFGLGCSGVACLLLMIHWYRQGVALYLFIFVPLTIVVSAINLSKEFRQSLSPTIWDQAGQFVNRYLGKDTSKLLVFGPDLAGVLHTNFFMSPQPLVFYVVANGESIDEKLKSLMISEDWDRVLLLGSYQDSFHLKEILHIPVKKMYADPEYYTLLYRKEKCNSSSSNINRKTIPLEFTPGPNTPHTTGRFDITTKSMLARKGEAGAIIFDSGVKLRKGCYQATYHIIAESDVEGAEIGVVDVTRILPPSIDDKQAYKTLRPKIGEQTSRLVFKVDNPEYLYQFRVWANGSGSRVSVGKIKVEQIDESTD